MILSSIGITLTGQCYDVNVPPNHWTPAQITTLRAVLGAAQRGLARLMAVHFNSVNNWERGLPVTAPNRIRLDLLQHLINSGHLPSAS